MQYAALFIWMEIYFLLQRKTLCYDDCICKNTSIVFLTGYDTQPKPTLSLPIHERYLPKNKQKMHFLKIYPLEYSECCVHQILYRLSGVSNESITILQIILSSGWMKIASFFFQQFLANLKDNEYLVAIPSNYQILTNLLDFQPEALKIVAPMHLQC